MSQELLDKVPELYRERARGIRLSADAQKRYLELQYQPYIFSLVAGRLAQTPEGVAFLFEAVDKEAVSSRRAQVLSTLASAKDAPGYFATHPDALNVYE